MEKCLIANRLSSQGHRCITIKQGLSIHLFNYFFFAPLSLMLIMLEQTEHRILTVSEKVKKDGLKLRVRL